MRKIRGCAILSCTSTRSSLHGLSTDKVQYSTCCFICVPNFALGCNPMIPNSVTSDPPTYSVTNFRHCTLLIFFTMLSLSRIATLLVVVLAAVAHGQDQDQYYQDDYSNDNLYHDYAARQNDKEVGAP